MDIQKREYFTDIHYKPFLFFVVFGVTGEELEISAGRHHVDRFPAKLELRSFNRAVHADYIDGFFAGHLGNVLKDSDPELFDACRLTENCVIISGQIEEDQNLDYMRNVIGIIQAFTEKGVTGILDLMTFSLFSPVEWKERFFEKEINAQNHTVILVSEEENGYWLHTRGMTEFGRPDFSIHDVKENEIIEYKEILDQMIFYGGQGVFFNGDYTLHTYSGKTCRINSVFVNDFENDDFNNAYCNVSVKEE
ncbi:MAG: hypothetical protein IKR11_09760 [Solobacterium sp.]|nr:hypothetical protein [Solobacterium sp.]